MIADCHDPRWRLPAELRIPHLVKVTNEASQAPPEVESCTLGWPGPFSVRGSNDIT